jgi:uncharacterized protein with NRDE domain
MAMAWGLDERLPLVLVANRDEFHARPSAPMAWWDETILAGRDLEAGGTWLGVSRQGRIGLLTNVREPGRHRADASSRGHIVPLWLDPGHSIDSLASTLQGQVHNGYNLLGLDLTDPQAHWLSNRHTAKRLPAGIYGLSNAALDTPWPKLQRLKAGLAAQLGSGQPPRSLPDRLLQLLTDRHQPADAELPATGVPFEWERHLGRIFIETPDRAYGTRCSTVIVVERHRSDQGHMWVMEQGWDAHGRATERREHEFDIDLRPAGTAASPGGECRPPETPVS